MGYDDEKMAEAGEDIGATMQAVFTLHKAVELLNDKMDRMDIKFRPVLRSVQDKPMSAEVSAPRPPHAEVTERLEEIGSGLERIGARLVDLLARCEL